MDLDFVGQLTEPVVRSLTDAGSGEHGLNAFLLYKALGQDLDLVRLEERAGSEDVLDAWNEVVRFARETEGWEATEEELREWARRDR